MRAIGRTVQQGVKHEAVLALVGGAIEHEKRSVVVVALFSSIMIRIDIYIIVTML